MRLLVSCLVVLAACSSPPTVRVRAQPLAGSKDQALVHCLVDGDPVGPVHYAWKLGRGLRPQPAVLDAPSLLVTISNRRDAEVRCILQQPGLPPLEATTALSPIPLHAVATRPPQRPGAPALVRYELDVEEPSNDPDDGAYLVAPSGRLHHLAPCGERSASAAEFCLPAGLPAGTYRARFQSRGRLIEAPSPLEVAAR